MILSMVCFFNTDFLKFSKHKIETILNNYITEKLEVKAIVSYGKYFKRKTISFHIIVTNVGCDSLRFI
jgi:hypothetical protein